MRALDVGHTDVLRSPDAIGRVNELLEERFREQGAQRAGVRAREGRDQRAGAPDCSNGVTDEPYANAD